MLLRNFPREAREQGIFGETRVRALVLADGTLSNIRVESGGEHGFGAACRRTLAEGGKWPPPLDRGGTPVPQEIEFTCDFNVRD